MANPQFVGAFIPTTSVFDISQIYSANVDSPEFKEFIVQLYQSVNNLATMINFKDTGYYPESQFVNGQLYFPNPALTSASATSPRNRQVYRKVINFGQLPNAASKQVAHGITFTTPCSITRLYGAATDTAGNYIPLPFATPTALNQNIELRADGTNVYVVSGVNRTNFTISYIVIEWLTS